MTDEEREGLAQYLLRTARMDACDRGDPFALAGALGVRLSPTTVPGCAGLLEGNPVRVRYDDRGPAVVVDGRLAHELAHLAAEMARVARPHDEEDMDAVGLALRVPREAVRRAVAQHGWNAERLAARFPDVEPSAVIARAARVAEGIAILHVNRRRVVAADERIVVPPSLPVEQALVAAVRASGAPCRHPSGVSAWPFVDPGDRAGIAVLGPAWAWPSVAA